MLEIGTATVLSIVVIVILCCLILMRVILKKPIGNKRIFDAGNELSNKLRDLIFHRHNFVALATLVLFVILLYAFGVIIATGLVVGAIFSVVVTFIEIYVLSISPQRVAEASRRGVKVSSALARKTGLIVGISTSTIATALVLIFNMVARDIFSSIALLGGCVLVAIIVRSKKLISQNMFTVPIFLIVGAIYFQSNLPSGLLYNVGIVAIFLLLIIFTTIQSYKIIATATNQIAISAQLPQDVLTHTKNLTLTKH